MQKRHVSLPLPTTPGGDAVRAAFARFDRNGSGRLDYWELREALRALGIDATSIDAARTLRAYDADGNGLMELDEFKALVKRLGYATDDGCCDDCCTCTGLGGWCAAPGRARAVAAGALIFVAGYAFALALHDERCNVAAGGEGGFLFTA